MIENIDFNNPDHYAFGRGILDGGATPKVYSKGLINLRRHFDEEPIISKVVNDDGIIENKITDYICTLNFNKLVENGYRLDFDHTNLNIKIKLSEIKQHAVELAIHRIDVEAEILNKLIEHYLKLREEGKQTSLF